MAGGADTADALHQKQPLVKMLGLGKFFHPAMVVADDDVDIDHLLPFDIEAEKFRFFLQRMVRAYGNNDFVAHARLNG
jgi:hypothetical protein